MKIVSFSIKDNLFDEMEKIKEEMSFKGRSEVIRYGLRMINEESKTMEKLKGHVDCVIILMHSHAEKTLSKILHKFDYLIKTRLHSTLCNDKCLELVLLHGESKNIKEIFNELKASKKTEYIKLVVP